MTDRYIHELEKIDFSVIGDDVFLSAVADPTGTPTDGTVTFSEMADAIWDRLYKRPVIVQCGYCNCHNAFSNPACVQCGAPMGEHLLLDNNA